MAESCSTSTAAASRAVSVREASDTLEKWRALPPHERLCAPCPDEALEAVLAYAAHSLEKEAVNSRTSGVPPSQDQSRTRGSKRRDKGKRKPGGQPGHKGTTAEWRNIQTSASTAPLTAASSLKAKPTAPKLQS